MRSPEGVIAVIEVKSIGSWEFVINRVGQRQKTRLQRAAKMFSEQEGACLLLLAVVDPANEVLVFDEVFR